MLSTISHILIEILATDTTILTTFICHTELLFLFVFVCMRFLSFECIIYLIRKENRTQTVKTMLFGFHSLWFISEWKILLVCVPRDIVHRTIALDYTRHKVSV